MLTISSRPHCDNQIPYSLGIHRHAELRYHQENPNRKYKYVSFFVTDCPSGTHRDIINGCATCPIGTYMDRPNREDSCIQCPEGTTTTEGGSVSEQDCDGEYAYNKDRVIIFATVSGNWWHPVVQVWYIEN